MKKTIEIADDEQREFGLNTSAMVDEGNDSGLVAIGEQPKKKKSS